jgi:hypothetical protein
LQREIYNPLAGVAENSKLKSYYGGPEKRSRYSDSLRARRAGHQIPVRRGEGARFSAPVQTGPGAHPTSYTMGNGSFPGVGNGSFPGVKWPRRDVDHPPTSSAEVRAIPVTLPLGLDGLL